MRKLLLSFLCLSFFSVINGQNNQIQTVNRTVTFGPKTINKTHVVNNKSLTACTQDSLDYNLAKANGLETIDINNATSAQAMSQYFNAPQAITIHGVSFYAYKLNATGGITLNATVEVYIAGPDSMPTGAPLTSTTVTVDTTFGAGSLPVLEKNVTFPTPITVNQPYVIVIGNYSPNGMGVVCNSWTAADGGQEWLSSIDIAGTWFRSYDVNVGGVPFDADALISPHVTYDLTVDFTANPLYFGTAPTTVNFTDNSSPVLQDRMYNQAAYVAAPQLSYTYDFGDGSPLTNAINTSNSYTAVQQYTATLTDTLYGWRTQCFGSESVVLNASSDLVITEIMYNPPEAGIDSLEFIEIYNNGSTPVNLANFYFSQGVTHTFTSGTVNAGDYFVITVDSQAFHNVFGFAPDAEWSSGGLSNSGEDITLKNPAGVTIDSVDYDDGGIWPSGASTGNPDGGGSSLILCNISSDNNIGSNWSKSVSQTGVIINTFEVLASPGSANFCCPVITSTDTRTECDSLPWIDGNTYYANNTSATFTLKTANNCDSTVTLNLTINNSATASVNVNVCNNSSFTYADGTVSNNIVANESHTSTLSGGAANNCDSIVTENLTVLPALTGSVSNTICDGDSIVVNGTTYNAGNPTGTEVFTNVSPNNCDSTVTVNLTINPLPTVTMATFSPDTICSTTPAFALPAGTPSSGIYTGNGVSGTNFDPNMAGTGSHYVVYTFTDGNNCTNADSSMITVEICTGVNTLNTLNNINIYPNPTEGMVTIDLGKSAENMQISILSIDGKLIQQINNVNDRIIPINMASFSKGVYILKVNDATQQSIHRIIKK